MKNLNKQLLIFFSLLFLASNIKAQKIFSEGYIKYDVFTNEQAKPSGVYIIYVKSGNIKRELSMDNGYNNITIYNAKQKKTFSYNIAEGNKYALELSHFEVEEKNNKFKNPTFTKNKQSITISGYQCIGSHVQYNNGEEADIFYTSDILPSTEKFNTMFPGLNGVALQYQINSKNGMIMKFVANTVSVSPLDSKIFTIPIDYKIVTKDELEKLK
ncbi:MAG: hypothetical protein UZ11_BCD004001882 [Bacteroidetes bacterium OLB11]|nr:MAG: hypothetical protein UZ11_BCD004001882 [Bacteroidetes bacterium OLB11]